MGSLLAAMMGALRAAWFKRREAEWSPWRRMVQAALLLPGVILGLMILVILYSVATLPNHGENGYAIAVYVILLFGIPLLLIALVSGLLGAAAVEKWRR